MLKFRQVFGIIFVAFAILISPSASYSDDVIKLKLAHTSSPNTIIYETYEKFKQELERISNGQVRVTIYPLSQLGGDIPSAEAVKAGSIDICSVGTNNMAPFTDLLFWADLPFMFKDLDGVHKVLGGEIGNEYKRLTEKETDFRLLFYSDPGSFRNLCIIPKLVRKPDDMKGLKLRSAASPVEMDTVRALGAAPTPVAWAESYMALEQRVVDGEMQQYQWLVTAKHEDVIRYITEIPGQYAFHLALMNKDRYAALPEEVRGWIDQAALFAQKFNFENSVEWNEKLRDIVRQAGTEIYTATPEEVAVWYEAGKTTWAQYEDKVPADLIDRIQAAQQ